MPGREEAEERAEAAGAERPIRGAAQSAPELPWDKGRGGALAGRGAWGCDGARWRGEEMRDPLPHWDKGSLPDSGALWAPPDGLPQACRAEDDDKAPAHRDGGGEAGDGRREAQVSRQRMYDAGAGGGE